MQILLLNFVVTSATDKDSQKFSGSDVLLHVLMFYCSDGVPMDVDVAVSYKLQ